LIDLYCMYRKIPEQEGLVTTGIDINAIGDGPVFACYSCDLVRRYPKHYSVSTSKATIVDTNKPWICPGGSESPRNCKVGDDSLIVNADQSMCVCKNGWYGTEETGCKPCEAGYYCVDGVRTQCEDHYFQPATEQTSCNPCSSTGDQDGTSEICDRGKQLPFCLRSDLTSQNQPQRTRCVLCSSCKRHYISPTAGQKDCYRS
jgi:hypothetical protein